MSDTTAVYGRCFACNSELKGGYTVVSGEYFHPWCAPQPVPSDQLQGPVVPLPGSVIFLDKPLPTVLAEKDAKIATLRAALADAEEALERFEKWRGITARDWENGAVRDEFRDMQKKARAVRERLAKVRKGEG